MAPPRDRHDASSGDGIGDGMKRLRSAWASVVRDPWIAVAVFFVLLLGFLTIYPQVWIARASLLDATGTRVSLDNFIDFFTTFRFRQAFFNSLIISASVTVGACLVAVPTAFLLARFDFAGKATVRTLMYMATISPPFLGAYAWVMLLGRNGIIMRPLREAGIPLPFESILGMGGVIWVGIWFTYALVLILAYDAFTNLDPSLEEAAMSVGASRWRAYLTITIKLITPAVLTGAYLSLVTAFVDFGTPMLIGGGIPVMPITVYYEFLSEVRTNPSMASAAGIIMILTSTLILLLQRLLLSRRSYSIEGTRRQVPRRLGPLQQVLMWVYLGVILLITFTPHLTVVFSSFLTWEFGVLQRPWQFTLDNYGRVLTRGLSPIYVSYFLGITATIVIAVAGALIAYVIVRRSYRGLSPALNTLVMMPYIIPGTVLAIGLILAFNREPLLLTGTWIILVLAYFIRRLPYAVKMSEAALYQVHPALEDAAMSVGASALRAFRDITVRLIAPAIISGAIIVFLAVITELSSTIMLYSAPWIPMTITIFINALTPGGPFGFASAMTVVLMISVYIPLYLARLYIDRRAR
jgi:iron(III) transport system permease protein